MIVSRPCAPRSSSAAPPSRCRWSTGRGCRRRRWQAPEDAVEREQRQDDDDGAAAAAAAARPPPPPLAREIITAETIAASAIVIRVQPGLGIRPSDPEPGLLDHVAGVAGAAARAAAEQHQQLALAGRRVVDRGVSEAAPEVAEDGLHVVVAARVWPKHEFGAL